MLSAFVGCNDVSDDASSSITTPTSSDVYNVDDDKTESNDNISGDNIDSSEEIKLSFVEFPKSLEVSNSTEMTQLEAVEFAENVVDEIKTLSGKIVQEEADNNVQEIKD